MSDNSDPPMAAPPIPPPPSPAPAPAPSEKDIRTWNMWCHMSALAGLIIPFGSMLGPLLVWQIKKHEIASVEQHGKAALNFQITVFFTLLAGFGLAFVLSFFCIGLLLFPLVGLIAVAGIVFSVIAGIKANDGKEYSYPFSLKMV